VDSERDRATQEEEEKEEEGWRRRRKVYSKLRSAVACNMQFTSGECPLPAIAPNFACQ